MKNYSVWVRPNDKVVWKMIGEYERQNAAIKRAEKDFDEKGWHQVAVIENLSTAVVFVVHD